MAYVKQTIKSGRVCRLCRFLLLIWHVLYLFRAYFSDNLVGLFVIVDID